MKICGVTSADDALLAAGLGADAIGMIFAASPRRIGGDDARDIVRRLPPEVLSVGVFRNESRERVVQAANKIGLRAVQLHGHETPEDTHWIGERVPAVIKAFSVKDPMLQSGADYGPHRLLIDAPMPGGGEVFDWTRLDRLVSGRRYILAGGLTADNVGDAIGMLDPWGVDVASGVEAAPGRKDPAKVRRFLAAVRTASVVADRRPARSAPVDAGEVVLGVPDLPQAGARQPFDWEEDS